MENELKPFLIDLGYLEPIYKDVLFENKTPGNKRNKLSIADSDIALENLKRSDSWKPQTLIVGYKLSNKSKLEKDDFIILFGGTLVKVFGFNDYFTIIEYPDGTKRKLKNLEQIFKYKVIGSTSPQHIEFGVYKIPSSFVSKFVQLQGYSTGLFYQIYGRMKSGGKETGIELHIDYPRVVNETMMSWEELPIVTKQYLVNNVLGSDDINNIDFIDITEMVTYFEMKQTFEESYDFPGIGKKIISKLPKKVFSIFEKDNASSYLDKIPKESLLEFHKLLVSKMSRNQRELAKNYLNNF